MTTGADVVDRWFDAQDELAVERVETSRDAPGWLTMLRGEWKRTIPVYLELGGSHLTVESFFMAAPDENEAALYRFLLHRNLRSYLLRFALYDNGDVMIVGLVPRAALTEEELDRVMGQLLATADDAFNQALRLGFATYIEREQAWREKVGAGRNPIS